MRWVLLLLTALVVRAQLPTARLNYIFPPAAQTSAAVVVAAIGADLDDATELRFSHPGITAVLKSGTAFTVTATTNVPPGIYEGRVIGRFGASNPRAFVVSDRPVISNLSTQTIVLNTAMYGKATAGSMSWFKFKANKGQRIIFECFGRKIDSKLEPVMALYDSKLNELERARNENPLDFSAPEDGEYNLKLHDVTFRGGDEYWFYLDVRTTPRLDFALPAAIEPGAKSRVTLYGRNLPGGKASEFQIDGKPLDQFEVEIEAPKEPSPSYLARIPASAALDAFEYRLTTAEGISNPILLSLASAKPVLESANNDRATNALVITPPCEAQGQFFPRRDVDWFQFEAAKGDVYWIEIFSQRLGLVTDPFAVVQRIAKNDKGEEVAGDVQELYDNDINAGGTEFNTATRDPAARFEAKEAGTYRIRVRDLFGDSISDPRRVYRLSIRKESPDFRLIAYAPAPPRLNKDGKDIPAWGAFLRRGDSTRIDVFVLRRDGFGGDIELAVDGLPKGVTGAPTKFVNGANAVTLILSASEEAVAWSGPLRIVGKARISDKEIASTARAGAVLWNVGDYQNEPVESRLTHELYLTVSGAELAPVAISAEKLVEAAAGSKVSVPLSIVRRGEFKGALKFTTLFEPRKEFEVAANATNATFELELDKTKLPPGTNSISFYATSPGRYRRVTPAEVKSIEDEIKKLKDGLAASTNAPQKEAYNNQIKALESRLNFQDITATFYSAAPIVVTAPPPAKKAP